MDRHKGGLSECVEVKKEKGLNVSRSYYISTMPDCWQQAMLIFTKIWREKADD